MLAGVAGAAWLSACTFASPTTSTYNAGKTADAGTTSESSSTTSSDSDGGAGSSTSSSSSASTGSGSATGTTGTAADSTGSGETLCCKQSSGNSAGTCIPQSAVPTAQAGEVTQDTCTGSNVCVPTSQVNNTPVKCSVIGGLAAGVCIGNCFSSYLNLASFILKSNDCGPDDSCVPCEALKGTGVAGCDQ